MQAAGRLGLRAATRARQRRRSPPRRGSCAAAAKRDETGKPAASRTSDGGRGSRCDVESDMDGEERILRAAGFVLDEAVVVLTAGGRGVAARSEEVVGHLPAAERRAEVEVQQPRAGVVGHEFAERVGGRRGAAEVGPKLQEVISAMP